MGNKGLLTIIAVALIGIFSILLIQISQEQDSIGNQIDEAVENITNEINEKTEG